MKMRNLIFCVAFLLGGCVWAQTPKWAKKAHQSIFSIIAFDAENKILRSGNGFFINEEGEAVSDYKLFKGAHRAIVLTSSGKEFPVDCILGVDELYDVIHFDVEVGKEKISALSLASAPLKTGSSVWLLPYSSQKEAACRRGVIKEVVPAAQDYYYYTLELPVTEKMLSCPVTNDDGEVIGLLQSPADGVLEETSYAVDVNYAASLSIKPLTANSSALRAIGIRKALPATVEEALVYLYMRQSNNNEEYFSLLNDFIKTYPQSVEGYMRRASYYVGSFKDAAHLQLAEQDMEKALALSKKKDEVYYHYCRLVYQHMTDTTSIEYKDWGIDKALEWVGRAIEVDSLPLYLQVQAELYFAKREYALSYAAYQVVNQSNMATASTYFSAARALELSGGDKMQVLALTDSAVHCYAQPYPLEAAPYIWERGKANVGVGNYRQAVQDYNEYHELVNGKVNALFYYHRAVAALAGRLNQLALDDIERAVELEPENVGFLAEKASVNARFGRYDIAIETCKRAVSLAPQYADCYRIMGVCYGQKGETDDALHFLQKAKELGDDTVDELIVKYRK